MAGTKKIECSGKYKYDILARLKNHIFLHVGSRPITSLTAQDYLFPCREAERRNARNMAHKQASIFEQVGKFAKVAGNARQMRLPIFQTRCNQNLQSNILRP